MDYKDTFRKELDASDTSMFGLARHVAAERGTTLNGTRPLLYKYLSGKHVPSQSMRESIARGLKTK